MKTDVSRPKNVRSPSATEPDPVSLKHRAYAALKSRILSGALSPGELLSERLLAQDLKMSKTPVHAALERLEGEGLVTVTAQQGIIVRAISPEEIASCRNPGRRQAAALRPGCEFRTELKRLVDTWRFIR